MPLDTVIRSPKDARALAVPAAIAGSIALMLSGAPAQAAPPAEAERTRGLTLRAIPAAILHAPATAAAAPELYTVVAGDTVSAIAARFGLRTADVLALNGLTWQSVIYPGQTLRLVGAAAPAAPAPAAPASLTYTVRGGDTVSGIAQQHGVTVAAMFAANGLGWSSIIYPGQSLAIPGATAAPAPAAAPAAASVEGLDAEQIANARVIIQVGRELGISDRGIAIALGTAMQESWIRNLSWGDRDSLGLFQQRPSTGWGTPAEILDPVRATKVFFGGAGDPNGSRTRGLLDIAGWEGLPYAQAAQAVQISAFPDRYARWEQPAYAWLAALG